jgi:hypothetical protein
MKRLIIGLVGGIVAVCLIAAPAQADVPSLQVSPLQYEDTLKPNRVSGGYIDVSNPSDSTVDITSTVRGFKQVGTNGDLEFFDDPDLSAAIKVGLESFSLGPREAVRVVFSVNASKLPGGGIYAAIFFRTTPPKQTSSSSFITQSANVGTLLILNNGPATQHHGKVDGLKIGLWQFGDRLAGSFRFQNTDRTARPIGFKPQLTARVLPWGHRQITSTGLVLPGVTRQFDFARTGSYFGLLPVTIHDADSDAHATTWVIACTGWYRPAVGLVVIGLAGWWLWRRRHPHRPDPEADDDMAEQPSTEPPTESEPSADTEPESQSEPEPEPVTERHPEPEPLPEAPPELLEPEVPAEPIKEPETEPAPAPEPEPEKPQAIKVKISPRPRKKSR